MRMYPEFRNTVFQEVWPIGYRFRIERGGGLERFSVGRLSFWCSTPSSLSLRPFLLYEGRQKGPYVSRLLLAELVLGFTFWRPATNCLLPISIFQRSQRMLSWFSFFFYSVSNDHSWTYWFFLQNFWRGFSFAIPLKLGGQHVVFRRIQVRISARWPIIEEKITCQQILYVKISSIIIIGF